MIKHQGDKKYSVSYVVHQKGEYIIFVKWGDDHIPGSPYRVVAWFKTCIFRWISMLFVLLLLHSHLFKSANYCLLIHYFFFLLPFAFFVFIFYTTSITILFPPLRWWYRMICALWTTYVSLYALIYTCQNLNWVKCLLSNKDINLLLYRHCFNSHSLHNWILGWMISINTK